MAKGYKHLITVTDTKGNTQMESHKARAIISGVMGQFIADNSKTG